MKPGSWSLRQVSNNVKKVLIYFKAKYFFLFYLKQTEFFIIFAKKIRNVLSRHGNAIEKVQYYC